MQDSGAVHHRAWLAVSREGDNLMERSVQRTFSTCSSVAEWPAKGASVVVSVVVLVRLLVLAEKVRTHQCCPIVFTASFGPGGFRTTRVRQQRAGAQNAANAEPATPRSILLQLAPLLLLFLFSFLSSVPSLFSTPPTPDPSYSFSPQSPYTSPRITSTLDIPYYVSPTDFSAHPIWATIPDSHKNVPKAGTYSRELGKFERSIERHWTNEMVRRCERERDLKERRIEQNSGWLGVGADWEAVKRIRKEKLESCEVLKEKNLITQY